MTLESPFKVCFKCGGEPQPLENFYKHSGMADGHLGKCKECTKKDVNKRYFKEFDKIQQYEKNREKTEKRRLNKRKYEKIHRESNPDKYKARIILKMLLEIIKLSNNHVKFVEMLTPRPIIQIIQNL